MTKGICRAAAISAALILTSSVTVQAVTVNIGTQGTVNTDSIQNWPKAPENIGAETAVLMDADTGAVLYDNGMDDCR